MQTECEIISKPLVTVLLPVYNRESVAITIDSILAQTFVDFELIVIDNASTDHTVDVVRTYNDNRIRLVINEKNSGQTYSLNRGLSLARGKYIARIDADDIALPNRLEEQVKFLESNPDYGLCGCWVQYINDVNKLTLLMKMCLTDKGLRVMQKITCGIYHPSAMIRVSILRENNITYNPNISMAMDYDMWFQIMRYSRGLNIGKVLLYYRRGSNNEGKKNADIMAKESYSIRRKICNAYALNEIDLARLNRGINLELKTRKSLIETIEVFRGLLYILKRDVNKESMDYIIIKRSIYLKVYSSCIAGNSAGYAKVIKCIYKFLLDMRYRFGSKRLELKE